ncbi:tRNA dihydrouridine synthase DusB [Candidatus Peregrinibacteria bacterium]|nr:tRNA dihydrouridine synthase DusB [Candidatus Peregrinibacteria bacterium]
MTRKINSFIVLRLHILAYYKYMDFCWDKITKPIVALAPMAGLTDASFRQVIKLLAPETVVYTEFLSTDAIHYGAKKTMGMINFDPEKERPFIVQIFGKDPEHFLSAAKIIEEMGADGIDINMGCPAAKVVSSCHGSALMKDVNLARQIVSATKKAVSIPVSVKTRLGWESEDELIPFCKSLIEEGADALAIHGRTYTQKFSGESNWDPIYELKKNVSVPVIGNGDINCAKDAVNKLGNLDGVMIGRGTFGNPWIMRDIADAIIHGKIPDVPSVQRLSFEEKIPFIISHCELSVKTKGERKGMLEMRKHLAGYVKGIDGASVLRSQLVRVESVEEVKQILSQV